MKQVRLVVLSMAALTVALGALAGTAVAKPTGRPPKSKGTSTAARGGELDTSFGKGGKVTVAFPGENGATASPDYTLPFEFTQGHLEMAPAPEGKTVVAGATKVVRLLANGKPDPTFGTGGTVTIPRPPGALFVLAGVAVDSQGRVVLAGLARPLPTNTLPDPVSSSAAVIRLTADGSLDPSFGNGGMVISSFGFQPPAAAGGPYPGGASVGLRDVAIDSQDRPVVTGGYVKALNSVLEPESEGFVARLTESGALDGSFGAGGIRQIGTLTSFGDLLQRSNDYLALGSTGKFPYLLLAGFDPSGNLDPGFGSFGFRGLAFGSMTPALALAPSGKILLLGRPMTSTFTKKVHRKDNGHVVTVPVKEKVKVQALQRLLPSGAADPSFGRVGRINFVDPKVGSYSAVAADAEERFYLVGRVGRRVSRGPNNPLHRTQFMVSRFLSGGRLDNSFGESGTVYTGFGGPSDSFATQVEVDSKGRILVGGGITSPQLASGGGFALARYLPGK
jgi:uncharacterized delta-60 repeat protein